MDMNKFWEEAERLDLRMHLSPEEQRAAFKLKDDTIARLTQELDAAREELAACCELKRQYQEREVAALARAEAAETRVAQLLTAAEFTDQAIELAGAMEVRRILEAIKTIAQVHPADDMPTPYQAAWQSCCEEIFYQATNEQWHMDEDADRFKRPGDAAIAAGGDANG